MAAVATERFPFVVGGNSDDSLVLRYRVSGTENESEAAVAAFTLAPAFSSSGLKKQTVQNIREIAIGYYDVDVGFGQLRNIQQPQPALGSWNYSFDISTELEHTFFSRTNAVVFPRDPATKTVIENRVANKINLNVDGRVEGVGVLRPTAGFSLSLRAEGGTVTNQYKSDVEDLVGSVNDSPFNRRQGGEVLFSAVRGQAQSSGEWTITFDFLVRKNTTNETIDGITGINKDGWDYIWPLNRLVDQDQKVVEKTDAFIVSKVYERGNFSKLGLGA